MATQQQIMSMINQAYKGPGATDTNFGQLSPEQYTDIAKTLAMMPIGTGFDNYNAVTKLLTGGNTKVGANRLGFTQDMMGKVMDAWNQQMAQEQAKLSAVSPAFDAQKYYVPIAETYDYGDGGGANKNRAILDPWLKISQQAQALQQAKQAAQKYQQTGVIDPYPDTKQAAKDLWASRGAPASTLQYVDKVVNNQLTPDDMKLANKAAAQVGASLPYPTAGIAAIQPGEGGLFTSDAQASTYYKDGKFDQAAYTATGDERRVNPKPGSAQDPNRQVRQPQLSPIAQSIKQQLDSGMSQTGAPLSEGQKQNLALQFQSATGTSYDQYAAAGGQTGTATGSVLGGTSGVAGSSNGGTSGGGVSATGGVTGGGTTGVTGNPNVLGGSDIKSALDVINGSDIDEGTKILFRQVVQNWDPNSEINFPNILKTFDDISKNTIDPYFKEQTRSITDEITRARDTLNQNAELEKIQESEAMNANIKNTQADLEARGMTFSGEGISKLGAQSAYAQEGTPEAAASAIPVQSKFGGQFEEGSVMKQNRVMSSSNSARRMQQLTDLSRQAEQKLGSIGSTGIVQGVSQLGGITGQLPMEQQQKKGQVLSDLYGQEQQNVAARNPLNPISS